MELNMQFKNNCSSPSSAEQDQMLNESEIFEKYKQGLATKNLPFKLFDLNNLQSEENNLEDDSNEERKIRGPYRKYTCEQKMKAVQRIQNGEDVKNISRQYGIPRRNILRWKKSGCQRKEGGGRPTDADMETIIFAKIKNQSLTDEKTIRNQAMQISKLPEFKASKGWFVKFCLRFNLTLGKQNCIFQNSGSIF